MPKPTPARKGDSATEKHRKDWRSSLDTYAVPMLGNMDVAHITHQDVLRVLNQAVDEAGGTLWETKTRPPQPALRGSH